MKHAILVGVTNEDPDHYFGPGPSLDAVEAMLDRLGQWRIRRVDGPDATRGGVVAALAELEPDVGAGDAVLFYFIGHGGVVEILDLPPPFGGRPVFYLATGHGGGEWRFEGVLDLELSLALARLDRRCGNVSAILDSCYSAQVVRGPVRQLPESPDWLSELARSWPDAHAGALLHPSSHPGIVRLAASSSLRCGYGDRVDGGHLGRLTGLVCETVRELDARIDRLTWDALAHRARERAIWRLGCEEQWVSLAGPRQRTLFSRREAPLPHSVGFVPRDEGSGGWIRAGLLQGVELDDEWGLAEPTLDDDLRPRWLTRMRVTAVDLNRAELEPLPGRTPSAPPGTSALLLRATSRDPILVEDPALREAVDRSAWLAVRTEQPSWRAEATRTAAGEIELTCAWADCAPLRVPADDRGRAAAVERLEDWARARRLLAIARARAGSDSPIQVSLRHAPSAERRLVPLDPAGSARVHAGGRLSLGVRCESTRASYFVSAVLIDVAGCPSLIDDAEPEGIEILAGETRALGEHPYWRGRGIELRWPDGVEPDRPRPMTLVVLASRRPIALGHLVRPIPGAGIPRDRPRRSRAPTRARGAEPRARTGPDLARDWGAVVIDVILDPRPDRPATREGAAG